MKSHKALIRQLNGACAFFLLISLSNCTGSQPKPEKQYNPAPIELYRGIRDAEKSKSANLILDEANELEENKKYAMAQKKFRELDTKFGEFSYIPSESESLDEDAGGISYGQIAQRRLTVIECKKNKKLNRTVDIRKYADNFIEAIRLINKDDVKKSGACEISFMMSGLSSVNLIVMNGLKKLSASNF